MSGGEKEPEGVELRYRMISQEQFASIGKFIVEFSGLESSIKLGISLLAPLPGDAHDELLAAYDFAMACSVLDALGPKRMSAEDAQKLSRYLKLARGLNTERVRVAHGAWQILGDFRASHVSRQGLKKTEHFKDEAELLALAREAEDLGLLIFSTYVEYVDVT